MKKNKDWLGVIAVAVAVAFLTGCAQEIESDPQITSLESASLSLASANPMPAGESGYRTYLYSEQDIDVYTRLGGSGYYEQGMIVQTIHVEVGDPVRRGQLLAQLEDDQLTFEADYAQAKADEARARLTRIEELRQNEFVSPSEYEEALYASRQADAELESAKLDLSRTRLRAPFDGVVSRRYVRQGELAEEGFALFRITAMTPLRARLLVPESEASAFRAGAPVKLSASDGQVATGRVLVVGPTIDAASGTREVIVELPEPGGFRPGAAVVAEPSPLREMEDR